MDIILEVWINGRTLTMDQVYWNDDDDFFEGVVDVTGGSGSGASLRVRVEAATTF